ncbi:UNVERIFIED_CONTAM: VapC toxin family PIN domain ribonuclease, partial [Escherichia coli]
AATIAPSDLTICVITVEEIERGIGQLPPGRRRELSQRWGSLLDAFADTVAVYDLPAARETARLLVAGEASGRTTSLANAQIAG